MLLRSLVWSKHTATWFLYVMQSPLISELAHHDKRLIEKIHRTYLNCHNDIAKRLRLLISHYQLLQAHFTPQCIQEIYLHQGIQLALSQTLAGVTYELWLRNSGNNFKEGELGLYWINTSTQITLAQLSFSLIDDADEATIYIAGLQGTCDSHARDWVRKATRQCDGLRPKRAVMEGLFALGKLMAVKNIVAVSDRNHVNRNRVVKKTSQASYDQFWTEFQVTQNTLGDYQLPLTAKKRDLSQIASKKRSEYHRRHERLDNLYADTLRVLKNNVHPAC